MQCFQCQHENPEGARFCNGCGANLDRICSACDHANPPGSHFCNACGHHLAPTPSTVQPETQHITQSEPSLTKPPIPQAERRQLTVMFCDLVDSTRLASGLDPEDLREVVRAYQECAAGVIQQYEGHIAQYLGDGLLIYFGWPYAHEDDAQRAVHTGLGIVEAVDLLNTSLAPTYGIQLAVRLGIHTGPVVVGEMGSSGRHEHLALGETPNIAARLEGLAQPGTVIISDDTRRLVAGAFHDDGLGTPELKGVSESIPVFRWRRMTASRYEGQPRSARDVITCLELTHIERLWHRESRYGHCPTYRL